MLVINMNSGNGDNFRSNRGYRGNFGNGRIGEVQDRNPRPNSHLRQLTVVESGKAI